MKFGPLPPGEARGATAVHTIRQGALVLKNHYESTAALAYVVGREVPGIEIFGGIDLNRAVGGLNLAAL